MSRLPIRTRLTAAFAVAMVLVLVAAALFVYLRLRSNLDDSIDNGLRSRSDDIAALVSRPNARLDLLDADRLKEREESFVRVLTQDGQVVNGSRNVGDPVLSPVEARQALRAPLLFERKVAGVEGTARVLARSVATPGRSLVVVVGETLDDRDEALSAVVRSFLIGGPIAVLLASAIGYLLATAAFAPVEAMRRRAQRISLTSGGERLPVHAARDELRGLGETLNEMLARLEASFERERRFVADASHELRTPLTVVKTELETALRNAGDDAKVKESLVAALEETDHLAQLAEDLLLIAHAAGDRLPVEREDVEVRELLERTRERFGDRARSQGREIEVEAPAGLRLSIDPLRTRQALGNLVDNALRHGAGRIRLSGRRANGAIEIDVGDEGPGFTAELVPHAFERFARGGGERVKSGAGLGLAIVRAIAEAHGGTARIVDGPQEGGTVRLRFPLAPDRPPSPTAS